MGALDVPGSACPLEPADRLESEVVRLYEAVSPSMLRFGALVAESQEAAQDALQEAFLRYFVARSRGQEIANPKAWLLRVMRNYLLDLLRASNSRRYVAAEDVADPQAPAIAEPDSRTSDLAAMFSSVLSTRELECLKLRTEGFRYCEISEILGIRSGTVGSLLARAHYKLRKAMGRDDQGEQSLACPNREVPYAP